MKILGYYETSLKNLEKHKNHCWPEKWKNIKFHDFNNA